MMTEIQNIQKYLPIAIVGMGLTGDALLKMLLAAGIQRDQIKTFDGKKPADYSDPEKLLAEFKPQSLAVSPGIPLSQKWIQDFKKTGKVTSELELATYFLKSEKIISITGSLGKSTTTALLAAGAGAVDSHAFHGGNFGIPLANYVTAVLQGKSRSEYVILELSSFQLENYKNLKSDISLLTFLSSNHLERYKNREEYYETKLSLFEKTKEIAFLNSHSSDISKLQNELTARFKNLKLVFVDRDFFRKKESRTPKIIGDHNLDNLAMVYAVADYLKWPEKSLKAILEFPGLAHRLENCGIHQEILFLNDSKATALDSVLEAAHSVVGNQIHLLLGGRDKNLPWEDLSILKNSRFQFHFFGEFGESAQKKSGLPGSLSPTLKSCLAELKKILKPQDVVLLSPGGTSFDEFTGFEDRGNYFKKWVLSEFKN